MSEVICNLFSVLKTIQFLSENEEKAEAEAVVEDIVENFNFNESKMPFPDLDEVSLWF